MERKRRLPEERRGNLTQTSSIRKRPRASYDRQSSLESKRPRYATRREKRYDAEHQIDTMYPEYHDSEGHFRYQLGGSLGDEVDLDDPTRLRYKILGVLGKGTFGLVLEAWDRLERKYVALKIVRAVKKYTESAHIEIDILTRIQRSVEAALNAGADDSVEKICLNLSSEESEETASKSSDGKKKLREDIPPQSCVQLESWFMFKGHVVMVFKKYGLSLYDFLEKNDFRPFEFKTIITISHLLFATLYYMHEGLELIHTDLKPENLIFVHDTILEKSRPPDRPSPKSPSPCRGTTKPYLVPYSPEIKVIDLGSAVFEHEHHGSVISTRHYRAPEVILQMGWSFPADIWSVGCIIIELFVGKSLFITHSNAEHLAMIKKIIGPADSKFLQSHVDQDGKAKKEILHYFNRDKEGDEYVYTLDYPNSNTSGNSLNSVNSLLPLAELVDARNYPDFFDLVKRTLEFDPAKRITASEALDHPFFDSVRDKYKVTEKEDKLGKEKKKKRTNSRSASTTSTEAATENNNTNNNTNNTNTNSNTTPATTLTPSSLGASPAVPTKNNRLSDKKRRTTATLTPTEPTATPTPTTTPIVTNSSTSTSDPTPSRGTSSSKTGVTTSAPSSSNTNSAPVSSPLSFSSPPVISVKSALSSSISSTVDEPDRGRSNTPDLKSDK